MVNELTPIISQDFNQNRDHQYSPSRTLTSEKADIADTLRTLSENGHKLIKDPADVDTANTAEEGDAENEKFSFTTLSSRKKLSFVLLGFANLSACTCFSLLAPFFPREAALKGMSQSVVGLVFSCFEFGIFVFSPIFGNYMGVIGPRFAFIAGQFVAGSCCIMFGTLYLGPGGTPFIVLCFLLRIVMSLGATSFFIASFTIVAKDFAGHVATVFGALEIFTGLGYVVGPLVGGALYDLGGFGLPFYVMGSLLLFTTAATFCVLPAGDYSAEKQQGSIVSLLASPLVIVCCITVILGCYCLGFMEATLSPHLEEFRLSGVVTGLLFTAVAGLYSLCSPFYGRLSEKGLTFPLIIGGHLICCLSFLLMGPTPLLPILTVELWLILVSLMVLGMGAGATIIPPLMGFYMGAKRLGFQEGTSLDGLVSGLLNFSFHFGMFLGPTIGSPLVEAYGFDWAATITASFNLFSVICVIVYLTMDKMCMRPDDKDGGVIGKETPYHTLLLSESTE